MSRPVRTGAALTYVGHGTVLLELDGVRLLVDPALRRWLGPLLRHGPAPDMALVAAPDLVLITHLHIDHLDLPSLDLLGGDPVFLVPGHGVELLRRRGFSRVVAMNVDASHEAGPVQVTAVEARHSGRRRPGATEGEALGYVVGGSRRVYVAGDTGYFQGMDRLAPALDAACLPVDGWGLTLPDDHLNPLTAARALTLLRPRIAVPIHWGTYYPPSLTLLRPRRPASAPAAFRRYAAHLAPDVDVRVLPPGAGTSLDI